MSFFQNTRKPEGLGGKIMVAMMNMGHDGFSDVYIEKNKKGWICVRALK